MRRVRGSHGSSQGTGHVYRRLRIRLTLVCMAVTGLLLTAMTCLCLYFSESGIVKNASRAFLDSLNSTLTHLESQTSISLQWIAGIEQNHDFILYLADNGEPLFYQGLRRTESELKAVSLAEKTAREEYGLDLKSPGTASLLSKHVEFQIKDESGEAYDASAILLPREDGYLSAVILKSLERQKRQIALQRFVFAGADLIVFLLFTSFFWFFIQKMLHPLEESRRQQAQFIASASHELRSPLAVMISCLTASRKASPEQAEHFTETIRTEGKRMSRLIDDMLQLANADACTWNLFPDLVSPDTLLLDMYEKYERLAREKKIGLTVVLPEEECPKIYCDEERITQVLTILLDNALSYTPPLGHIVLKLNFTPNHIHLSVADDGPGIPDAEKKQVFQRFYRQDKAHTSKEHFGLGLSIAKEIVRLHKGRLILSNTPGGGATFTITLRRDPSYMSI